MTRYLSPPATTFSSPFPPEIGHGFHLHPHRRSYLFVLVGDWLRWGSTKNADSFLQALLRRALVQGKHWFFIFFSLLVWSRLLYWFLSEKLWIGVVAGASDLFAGLWYYFSRDRKTVSSHVPDWLPLFRLYFVCFPINIFNFCCFMTWYWARLGRH